MEHMTEFSRQRSVFGAWYDRNAVEYNARRQARYAADDTVKQKAREQAARYRKKVVAEGLVPHPRNGRYTTAYVASILGVSGQTMRNWDSKGVIPKATNEGKHRLYTQTQVELLSLWHGATRENDWAQIEESRQRMFKGWNE